MWGRYDTPGSTLYLAETPDAAFREVLSSFALDLKGNPGLQADANFMGMDLHDYVRQVGADWNEEGYMNTGCLPAQWRTVRDLYAIETTIEVPWVDIEHPETIAAIRASIGAALADATNISDVTLGEIHGPNREISTRIAEWMRTQILDDSSRPVGIKYTSKYGGPCRAYWLRSRDEGLGEDSIRIAAEQPITMQLPSFVSACAQLGLKCF